MMDETCSPGTGKRTGLGQNGQRRGRGRRSGKPVRALSPPVALAPLPPDLAPTCRLRGCECHLAARDSLLSRCLPAGARWPWGHPVARPETHSLAS